MNSENIHIYTIAHSEETFNNAPKEWKILDNRTNMRPDWFEYWPIRNFLLSKNLDPKGWYGFFSPKFTQKTSLIPKEVNEFIQTYENNNDIITFSPFHKFSTHLFNQFQRHSFSYPPTDEAFRATMTAIGISPAIENVVADSRNTAYCNYFVARLSFWNAWIELGEKIFFLCENSNHPIREYLNSPTSYFNVQLKVFIIEDLVSIILLTQSQWRCKNYDIFKIYSNNKTGSIKNSVIFDALKISYQANEFMEYIDTFVQETSAFDQK